MTRSGIRRPARRGRRLRDEAADSRRGVRRFMCAGAEGAVITRRRRRFLELVLLAGTAILGGAASAQQGTLRAFDIAGNWVAAGGGPTFAGGGGFQEDHPERQDGPTLVDYTGIPLNEAGRARALSY